MEFVRASADGGSRINTQINRLPSPPLECRMKKWDVVMKTHLNVARDFKRVGTVCWWGERENCGDLSENTDGSTMEETPWKLTKNLGNWDLRFPGHRWHYGARNECGFLLINMICILVSGKSQDVGPLVMVATIATCSREASRFRFAPSTFPRRFHLHCQPRKI